MEFNTVRVGGDLPADSSKKLFRWVSLLALIAMISGCGEEGPQTYPVSGQVVYKNGKTLPLGGRVRFYFANSEPPLTAQGRFDATGRFEQLTTFKSGDGAVAGEHAVIVLPDIPDDKGAMSQEEYNRASDPIDPRFKGYKSSGLKFTVSAEGTNDFKIEVTRPRR